ncbi:MAG TPA: ATP-binding domain-containing protein, partial [Pseudomonadales bacterium]|nr:ATP-binding domain-containing protein [Pseudomonadales bacterium]
YNGDLGIVVDDEDGHPLAVFAHAGGVRLLPAARLPEHETAYALTVHKSQGSEFDRIALVLPPAPAASGLAGRELLYTAITRARTGVELLLPGGRLDACWLERARLRSGLARRLQSGHDEPSRRTGARARMAV